MVLLERRARIEPMGEGAIPAILADLMVELSWEAADLLQSIIPTIAGSGQPLPHDKLLLREPH